MPNFMKEFLMDKYSMQCVSLCRNSGDYFCLVCMISYFAHTGTKITKCSQIYIVRLKIELSIKLYSKSCSLFWKLKRNFANSKEKSGAIYIWYLIFGHGGRFMKIGYCLCNTSKKGSKSGKNRMWVGRSVKNDPKISHVDGPSPQVCDYYTIN